MKFTAAVASLFAMSNAGELKIEVQDEVFDKADLVDAVKSAHFYAPTIIYDGE